MATIPKATWAIHGESVNSRICLETLREIKGQLAEQNKKFSILVSNYSDSVSLLQKSTAHTKNACCTLLAGCIVVQGSTTFGEGKSAEEEFHTSMNEEFCHL